MTKTMKTSLAVFRHELQLQFISIGLVLFFLILSMLMTKFILFDQRGLDQIFIGFYTVATGFILPWQLNTRGHIAPGYCKYHLSLPVATWQLSVIPLLSRLALILSFIVIEVLLQLLLFGTESDYVTPLYICHLSQAALIVYLLLQAFAWSKDCFKNLFSWIFIAIGLLFIFKPQLLTKIFDNNNFIIYLLIIAALSALTLIGVRNLRRGIVYNLPGLHDITTLLEKLSIRGTKQYKNAGAAHFNQLWKRSWFIMPLITLAIIGATHVISKPINQDEWLAYGCTRAGTAYAAIIIIASLVGIIMINGKAFNSAYTANLPVNPRTITTAKIKCFCLSFAICLGIFLLWIAHMLFIDGRLLEAIAIRSEVLLHSPGVIIWMPAAFIIWSYALAFAVITGYMKYRIFTFATIVVVITLLIDTFFVSQRIYSIIRFMGFRIPAYVIILSGINILLFGKLALCCCSLKKLKRYLITIAVCLGAVPLTFLCCKYPVLFFIPLAALFAYPIIAMEYDDKQLNDEIIYKAVFPKRLLTGIIIIFLCFSGFTAWLNSFQQSEISSLIKQCEKQDIPMERPPAPPSGSYTEYVKQHLPYKKELLTGLKACIISGTGVMEPWKIRMFLIDTISGMLKQHEYRKAFEVLMFSLKLGRDWTKTYPCYSQMKNVLKYYTPSLKELDEITDILRKSLKCRLQDNPGTIISIVTMHSKFPPAFTFMSSQYYYVYRLQQLKFIYSNRTFNLPYFSQCFLSPLCYNERINTVDTAYHTIKALNFMLTGERKYFTTHRTSGSTYTSGNHWWTCNSILMAAVDVAIIKYQRKYGKNPKSIKQLEPEFLHKNEIWLFGVNFYKPILSPNSLKRAAVYN